MEITRLFLVVNGKQEGPFTLEQVREAVTSGKTPTNNLCWYEGIKEWIPLDQLPGNILVQIGIGATPPPAPDVSKLSPYLSRLLAAILDGLIIGIPLFLIGAIATNFRFERFNGMWPFHAVLTLFYGAAMESSNWQATLGKRAVNLYVCDENGARINFLKALARNLVKIAGTSACYLGVIPIFFTPKRQALQDIVVKTLVLKK